METNKIEPLKPEKITSEDETLNDTVAVGVYIDNFAIGTSGSYAVLDGIVSPPRTKKDVIAIRMVMPVDMLNSLQKMIPEVLEEIKKAKKEEKAQKSK